MRLADIVTKSQFGTTDLNVLLRDRPLCMALHFLWASLTQIAPGSSMWRIRQRLDDHQQTLLTNMLESRFKDDKACMAASSDFIAHLSNAQVNEIMEDINVGQRDMITLFIQIYMGWTWDIAELAALAYHPAGIQGLDDVFEEGASAGVTEPSDPAHRLADFKSSVSGTLDALEGNGWPRTPTSRSTAEHLRGAMHKAIPADDAAPLDPQQLPADLPTQVPIMLAEIGFAYQRLTDLLQTHGIALPQLQRMQALHAELVEELESAITNPN